MHSVKYILLAIVGIGLSIPAVAQTVTSIAISSTLTNVYRGESATLSCVATLSTSGTEACPTPVYTESSGGSVITLSGASFVGYAFGTTTVTATSSGKTGTITINDVPPPQEPLGIFTSTQALNGLGFNVTPQNDWEFALAKAAGATQVRFQCGWAAVEQQTAPPTNAAASPQYALPSYCTSALTSAKNYGLNVDIVAAYGPPYHQILTVTVPAGAAAGATTLNITFSSGVGGDTISKITPLIDNILSSTNSQITNINSYAGGLITGVTLNSSTTATITLASGLSTALPAGTATYVINEGLYAPPANWAVTNASVVAYANYVQYLAQQMNTAGVTGQVELWNEPAWPGDPWDNILDYYDTSPASLSPGPTDQFLPDYGFAAKLQTMTPPAGVTYNWGGTEKSGGNTLIGSYSAMSSETSAAFTEPATSITSESLHPYGNNPEDNLWSTPWLSSTTGNNDYYTANLFGVGPNFSISPQMSMLAKQTNATYGIANNITETGFNVSTSDATHQARFALRQLLGFEAAGVTYVNFYRLYDTTGDGLGFTDPTTEAPLQGYTALAGLQSDVAIIGNAPVVAYSSATLSTVTSWGNTTGFPLDTEHIVGSKTGATQNSELMILYQRSYVNPSSGTNWYSIAQPTAAPVTITMPAGQQLISATNLTTRATVSTTVSGLNVTLNVSDDPIELLIEPLPPAPTVSMLGSVTMLGKTSLTSVAAPSLGSVSYASADTCDAADYSGATETTMACTTGAVTAGDTIIIGGYNADFTTATDSLGGTITELTGFPYTWNGSSQWQMYCLANASAGVHTITLSGSPADQYVSMAVLGFHGGATTNPCTPMTTAGTATGTGLVASGGTVTTTIPNSAVIGFFQDSAASDSPGSGYTLVASPNAGFGLEYQIAPTLGSYTPTFSLSGTDDWVVTSIIVQP